ncbi:MAG: phospho-sugar mutase [Angustibacter sp.]
MGDPPAARSSAAEPPATGSAESAGSPQTAPLAELVTRANAWRDDDPDPSTRAELDLLLHRAASGDRVAAADLADRFRGVLEFGTAGLRGPLGAGPRRMNRAVVILAAAGLTAWLRARPDRPAHGGPAGKPDLGWPRVVIGYDARHRSADFARDTAAVITAAGGAALLLPRPLPTPVLAFAVRHLRADAGVMVTASHNPAPDNGYKVFLDDGGQLAAPWDAQIAARIADVAAVADVPRAEAGWQVLGDAVLEAYLDAATGVVSPWRGGAEHPSSTPADGTTPATAQGPASALRVVHTPLHGVGGQVLGAAFRRAGFPTPHVVPEQAEPDPRFPTITFPNPEEPGALDGALAEAERIGADLVLATDPDADRCAVAVPLPPTAAGAGGWRMLTGDEVGVLLGAHLIDRLDAGQRARAVLASSIVSSRQLGVLCAQAGVRHVQTLTGFKWIARVPDLSYGYEEALGYCVAPDVVRDKDGITAALLLYQVAAGLATHGGTLLDRLDELARRTGVHLTSQYAVRVAEQSLIADTMARLRAAPPSELAGIAVTGVDDLLHPNERTDLLRPDERVDLAHPNERAEDLATAPPSPTLPATDGLRWVRADHARVLIRPSGTEPKLKCYLEVVRPVDSDDVPSARAAARTELARLQRAVRALVNLEC